MTWCNSN